MYPKDRTKSQMFFANTIKTDDLVENLRTEDPVVICAKLLHEETKKYDFLLDDSYNASSDLLASYGMFRNKQPMVWNKFFDSLFPNRKSFDGLQRKCDTIYQIVHALITKKKTPLHIFVAQAVHDVSRSKKLIIMLNRLGLSISYLEMMRIDTRLAKRTIMETGNFRVPVNKTIKSGTIVQAAMDNFDHDEGTLSGKNGSHDTILMLFQNNDEDKPTEDVISTIPESLKITADEITLKHILPCQLINKATNLGKRGEIADDFISAGEFIDLKQKEAHNHFLIWSVSRSMFQNQSVPSFQAVNSVFDIKPKTVTRFAFTPIIPHPATEYDTIFTCMRNFQDVLIQRDMCYGPLWCDEGVYRIAKELQLLNPILFSNIFLGLGGFHMEKILISCCGSYLKGCGIENVFVENDVFGPGVVQSVMSGGHYVRGKKGMMMLAETLQQLQFKEFNRLHTISDENSDHIKAFQDMLACAPLKENVEWEFYERKMQFIDQFEIFNTDLPEKSNQFAFWHVFLNHVVSVLIDLTRSHREGNWDLHLSATRRAIPLFFFFNRTNYKRWVPLYFEDCMAKKHDFPELWEHFCNGKFVVHQTKRKGSGIPMDQALEKQYNKPAKGPSGVIGFTRRKEAVCKWNIIKHEKFLYNESLSRICQLETGDQYTLHHEFSESATKMETEAVIKMTEFINERGNPFDASSTEMKNLSSGEQLNKKLVEFRIKCIVRGEKEYQKFKEERLDKKTVKLFDTISKVVMECGNKRPKKHLDVSKATVQFMRQIDIARTRSYDLKKLLQHELTSTSLYLTKDGFLRKSPKSELAQVLKHHVPVIPTEVPSGDMQTALIIDFMAYCRKVPIKKLLLKTYADLAKHLWTTFQCIFPLSQRIDIIFDLYLDKTIKQGERSRRSKGESIEITIKTPNQALPVEVDKFWGSSTNKMQLEQIFIAWFLENYEGSRPIFLEGANKDDITSCIMVSNGKAIPQQLLKCDHEEADDRMLFHANHAINVGYLQKDNHCVTRY